MLDALRNGFSALHHRWAAYTASINPNPIFVLGNQKSGTTVIAALLAKYADRSVTLDLPGLYEPTQTRLHNGDLGIDQFVKENRIDFSRDIIKEPCLTFLYDELREAFPGAQFVYIARDPRDNIRSILNRVSIPGNQAHLSDDQIASLSPEWRLIFYGDWLGLSESSYIDYLAARWMHAARVYLDHKDQFSLVRYEDFTDDKSGTIASLAQRLSLSPVHDIQDEVDVQYQPRGKRNVDWSDFFGETNLRRIEQVCGDAMTPLGYSPRTLSSTQ